MQALEDGTLEQCQQKGINPMFWSPLAGGKLFAKDDEKAARLQACLTQVAQEIGAQGIDQVVYAWLHALPSQPAIVLGTSNITRVQSAVESQQLRLNREQWYRIWSASTGHSVA
jgi:predicted oxidoreductase